MIVRTARPARRRVMRLLGHPFTETVLACVLAAALMGLTLSVTGYGYMDFLQQKERFVTAENVVVDVVIAVLGAAIGIIAHRTRRTLLNVFLNNKPVEVPNAA